MLKYISNMSVPWTPEQLYMSSSRTLKLTISRIDFSAPLLLEIVNFPSPSATMSPRPIKVLDLFQVIGFR